MKKMAKVLVMMCVVAGLLLGGQPGTTSKAAGSKEKAMCAAALKRTGNAKKLNYKSTTPYEFDAISYKHQKKVKSMYFVTSDNTAYVICVAKAKTTKQAKALYSAFGKYKYNKMHDTYFKKDYKKSEQSVIKNAVYGRKGAYVWYIAMSSKKKNLAGQAAIKKKIK
ncbi:MAG: hypothetical protein SO170_07645 [Butyribacter sp.]|nr:hypothetical protein [bacterium]MDY3854808.1 hypothetical protein [Butyribacter sp.]